MRLKELLNTIERTELYVYAVEGKEYKTLAMPSVRSNFNEYHNECEKLRALANADEYIVKRIGLLEPRDGATIFVECEKEAE